MLNTFGRRLALFALGAVTLLPGAAMALPVIWWQIDSGPVNYLSDYKTDGEGLYEFEFSDRTGGYNIQGNILVDSDPFIAWGMSVLNNTDNPMTFTTGMLNTLFAPISSGRVFGSFSGSVTDIFGDGVTITPVNAKIQTSTLNTTQNMGVDVGGPFAVGGGIPGGSYIVPPDQLGPMLAPPGGPWTSMELVGAFTLSKRDIATVNGFASINPIPEPASLFLLGSGLLGIAIWRRRKLF